PFLDAGVYLVAVNTMAKPVKVEFKDIQTKEGKAINLFTSEKVNLLKGELKETFESYGVRIWYFKKKKN
ncbi:MAG: hypothetical protein QF701_14555, partial [Nitrospinota bacterium]|nr:hypothetical protein [Nitrospinota bacterium]